MLRRFRAVFLVSIVAFTVAGPVSAHAVITASPHIDSVSPSQVFTGAPDTAITVTGSGFVSEGSPVVYESDIYVDGGRLPTTYVDGAHLTATIPSSMFEHEGQLGVWVYNEVPGGGPFLALQSSNQVYIDVVQTPPPPPAGLKVMLDGSNTSVGQCFDFSFVFVDQDGNELYSQSATVELSSDDVSTAAPNDGAVQFFNGWCEGDPITGTQQVEGSYLTARRTTPGDVTITVHTLDPDRMATSDAFRIAGGSMAGRVTDTNGAPVAGAAIYAASPFDAPPVFIPLRQQRFAGVIEPTIDWNVFYLGDPVAHTAADGSFDVAAIGPGSYHLDVAPPADTHLAAMWLGNVADSLDAREVTVTDGVRTDGLDVVLPPGGAIEGTVTVQDSGAPLKETTVAIADAVTNHTIALTGTDVHGRYRSLGLPAGSYSVHFQPQDSAYLPAWYSDATTTDDATRVAVPSGVDVSGVDQSLALGASFEGTVSGADDGAPVASIVRVYSTDTGEQVANGYADQDRRFHTSPGLPAGNYKLRVEPYGSEWYWKPRDLHVRAWIGGDSFPSARTYTLDHSETSSLDLTLPLGGTVSGRVLGATSRLSGVALPVPGFVGAAVYVIDAKTGQTVGDARTDQFGKFTAAGIPYGNYLIRFQPFGSDLAPQWYPNTPDRARATVFEIGPDIAVKAQAYLHPAGTITGRLTISPGPDDSNTRVSAFRDGVPNEEYDVYVDNSGGSYSIGGLPEGTYRVVENQYAWWCCALSPTVAPTTWYPDAATRRAAKPVVVKRGRTTKNIDITVGAPSFISGYVSGADDAYGEVTFLDAASQETVGFTWVDENSDYLSPALHPGAYVVRFDAYDRAPQYYGGGRDATTGTVVDVSAPSTKTGIDITMAHGTHIRGSVHSVFGAPLDYLDVAIVDATTGEDLGSAWVSNGTFTSTDLAPGRYKVYVSQAYDDVYAPHWYVYGSTFEEAAPVTLTASGDTSGVDVYMQFNY